MLNERAKSGEDAPGPIFPEYVRCVGRRQVEVFDVLRSWVWWAQLLEGRRGVTLGPLPPPPPLMSFTCFSFSDTTRLLLFLFVRCIGPPPPVDVKRVCWGHAISTKPLPSGYEPSASISLLSHTPASYFVSPFPTPLPSPPLPSPILPRPRPTLSRVPPASSLWHGQAGGTETYYAQGFPVGQVDDSTQKVYVNNHVHMVVDYHPMEIGEVSPFPRLPSLYISTNAPNQVGEVSPIPLWPSLYISTNAPSQVGEVIAQSRFRLLYISLRTPPVKSGKVSPILLPPPLL